MRGLVLLRAVLAALLLAALSGGVALASNKTADTAVVLSAANPSGSGIIANSGGDVFRYYRFTYPGANAQVYIHLTWNPGWGTTDAAFNFNLYGPGGFVARGTRGDDVGPASTSFYTLESQMAGDYLVQVYNYAPEKTVAYTLDTTGLGAPPLQAVANVEPQAAMPIVEQSPTAVGNLVGRGGGAFNYFDLAYPGVNWETRVSLTFRPAKALPDWTIGVNVYDGDTLVATASEAYRDEDVAIKTVTVKRFQPGLLRLQVYNYADGVAADYTLGTTGAIGSGVSASGNDTPGQAIQLSPTVTSAHGTLSRLNDAAFQFYSLNYPGGYKQLTLSMHFRPGRSLAGDGVGFNIFRGAELVSSSTVTDGRNAGEGLSYLTWSSDQPGDYSLQVFSYAHNIPVDYDLYIAGLE